MSPVNEAVQDGGSLVADLLLELHTLLVYSIVRGNPTHQLPKLSFINVLVEEEEKELLLVREVVKIKHSIQENGRCGNNCSRCKRGRTSITR